MDSNKTLLAYVKEGVFSETPDKTKRLTRMRIVSAALTKSNQTVQSEEITGTRNVKELIKVGVGAAGNIPFEMVYGDWNPFLVSLMQGTPVNSTVTVDTTVDPNAQTISSGDDDFSSLAGARWLKITGMAVSANNGVKRVVSIASGVITFAAGSLITETDGTGVSIQCYFVRNGVKDPQDSYLIEESFPTATAFQTFIGMTVNDFGLELKPRSKAMGTISLLGYDGLDSSSSYGSGRSGSILSTSVQPVNGDYVSIVASGTSGRTYTFQTVLTNVDGNVLIGASLTATLANLKAAINLEAGAGSTYAAATTANTTAYCISSSSGGIVIKSVQTGTSQNGTAILVSEKMLGASWTGEVKQHTTLLSNNTNVSNNDTVSVGGKTYTFKTSLTPTEGEVLIGGSADASLLNLIRAINHTGTPNTDYKCAARNAFVSAAASVTSHSFVITALQGGNPDDGDAITEAKSAVTLSFTTETAGVPAYLTGGLDPIAASDNPVINTTTNIGTIFENGVATTNPLTSVSLKIGNSERERPAIGQAGTLLPGSGDCIVTGKLESYFKTRDQLTAFYNHAARSLEVPLVDGLGNVLNFYFPLIKYSSGSPPVTAKNTDIVLPLDFQATQGAGGFTAQIDLLGVA